MAADTRADARTGDARADARPHKAPGGDDKQRALTRLRRIEGQVRGVQRMLEEDRYCVDVLHQIESVQEALRGVARGILREHLRHCATKAFAAGGDRREEMVEELVGLALPK